MSRSSTLIQVLVEAVGRQAMGTEPHRAACRLAELGAIGLRHERPRQAVRRLTETTPDQIDSRR